jgi:hypothetical protein
VQRNASFSEGGTPIPFDFARVNMGNAMNLTSGVFTAPRTGVYFFSFTGTAQFTASPSVWLGIGLYLNGGQMGLSWIEEANITARKLGILGLQSTLNLKKGDQVWLKISDMASAVSLFDDDHHHTHFTGFMLEEETFASF